MARRRELAELALADSPRAIERIRELIESDNDKVALGACVANLKVAGVMSDVDSARIERAVEKRLEQLIAEAEASREPQRLLTAASQ